MAVAVGAGCLLLSWLVIMIVSLLQRFRRSRPVSCRPGEVVHQALKITGRRWDYFRTAALLFCVSLPLLLGIGRHGWWLEWSIGIYAVIAAALVNIAVQEQIGFVHSLTADRNVPRKPDSDLP